MRMLTPKGCRAGRFSCLRQRYIMRSFSNDNYIQRQELGRLRKQYLSFLGLGLINKSVGSSEVVTRY